MLSQSLAGEIFHKPPGDKPVLGDHHIPPRLPRRSIHYAQRLGIARDLSLVS